MLEQARVLVRQLNPSLASAILSQSLGDSLHPMAPHGVPNEIWLYIFELATAEYLPDGELPNSMDKSAWFKNVFGLWCLQSPSELAMNAQKKHHKTVKVRRMESRMWKFGTLMDGE